MICVFYVRLHTNLCMCVCVYFPPLTASHQRLFIAPLHHWLHGKMKGSFVVWGGKFWRRSEKGDVELTSERVSGMAEWGCLSVYIRINKCKPWQIDSQSGYSVRMYPLTSFNSQPTSLLAFRTKQIFHISLRLTTHPPRSRKNGHMELKMCEKFRKSIHTTPTQPTTRKRLFHLHLLQRKFLCTQNGKTVVSRWAWSWFSKKFS